MLKIAFPVLFVGDTDMKKRVLSLLLSLVAVFSLTVGISALAASESQTGHADALYQLGLFRGTGTTADGTPVFDLEKVPTRNQAVIMLVRLLGKEEEALAGTWDLPFTDVAKGSTAYPYIGYAYANGLTNGTSATTYSGTKPVRANQYITFVLRALGYVSGKDFQVATAWELSDQLGITAGEYNAANAASFIRGDVAAISAKALSAVQNGSTKTLAEKLMAEGVFTAEQYARTFEQESETVPEEPQEEAFTLTAFGDKWLHEYLMSLDPSSVTLGPTIPARSYFDSYYYTEQYIADEIIDVIKDRYTFERIEEAKESGTDLGGPLGNPGTRVETLEDPVYGRFIGVATFELEGYFYETDYYLRWRTDRP